MGLILLAIVAIFALFAVILALLTRRYGTRHADTGDASVLWFDSGGSSDCGAGDGGGCGGGD